MEKKETIVILASIISVFILSGSILNVLIWGTTETSNVVSAENSYPIIDKDELSSKKCTIYEDCDNGCEVDFPDVEDECCISYRDCDGDCGEIDDCSGNCSNDR